ncbi:ABC transporter permease subunit [Aquirufa sp. KTFRIE-69F]|uniref:ABC transporter permease subunit n=1 Tax=Aquirufa originis TaxID=3096514 RepID=A0ABW6D792_9BACT
MFTLLKKDVLAFFSSWMGWGTISSFFILMGVYVWVIDGNLLDYGFAELTVFFDLSPWFFLFFVPALSMNSFSEEMDRGTFQLLRSLPISTNQILFAKLGALAFIVLITLLPSVIFIQTISVLGLPENNYDSSLIIGGFIALFLLVLCFVAMGLFASSLSKKQPVAFIIGLGMNFVCWQGAKEVRLDFIDLSSHYNRMSMGVLSFSDLLFFVGFITLLVGVIRLRLRFLI